MENEKLFEFMEKMYSELKGSQEKMYSEMQDGFNGVKDEFNGVRNEFKVVNGRLDAVEGQVAKLGVKIDGEVSDKIKALSEEQSIMRKEVSEINQGRAADRCIIQDIKLEVDALYSKQNKQEAKIIELDEKLAK